MRIGLKNSWRQHSTVDSVTSLFSSSSTDVPKGAAVTSSVLHDMPSLLLASNLAPKLGVLPLESCHPPYTGLVCETLLVKRLYIPRNLSSARLHCSSSAGDMWANRSLRSMLAASASLSGSRVDGSARSGGAARSSAVLPALAGAASDSLDSESWRSDMPSDQLLHGHSGLCGFLDPTFFMPPLDPSRSEFLRRPRDFRWCPRVCRCL